MTPRAALVLATLLGAAALAGCAGDAPVAPAAEEGAASPEADEDAVGTTAADANASVDAKPHLHDYWAGRERVVLLDEEVTFDLAGEGTFMNAFTRQDPAVGGARVELPEGVIVYEGTGRMDVTATWTDPTITSLAVGLKPPTEPETRDSFRKLEPLASGQPHERAVAPQETDMPHEGTTRWGFYFSATGPGNAAVGKAQIRIEIVRMRDVTLFPAHPETFVDADRYVLADKDFAYEQASAANLAKEAATSTPRKVLSLDRGVPMGTRVMTIDVTVTNGGGSSALFEQSGLEVLYRGADGVRYRTVPYAQEGTLFKLALPVEDAQVDSPYAETSVWRIGPTLRQQVNGTPVDAPQCPVCVTPDVQGHAVVTAWAEVPAGVEVPEPEVVG